MNRRDLIKKGLGLSVAATGILGIFPSKSKACPLDCLIQQVHDLNLHAGIENSLDAKIEAAIRAKENYNDNNLEGVINALEAFDYAVEAQRGKNISDADADTLLNLVDQIINELYCVPPCGGSGGI
jgi:hypothetical protein